MQVPCTCHDWLSFFLAICLMGFLPCRVAKLSKDLHASDLTNEIVIPRNISVQGKLPTDDSSISYQNTISIGFHGWNDMQRPSTLCSAVWPETMEVSLPCTSPAAPRVIRAPLLSQGSRTTALAWEVWKNIVKLLVTHSDSLQIYKLSRFNETRNLDVWWQMMTGSSGSLRLLRLLAFRRGSCRARAAEAPPGPDADSASGASRRCRGAGAAQGWGRGGRGRGAKHGRGRVSGRSAWRFRRFAYRCLHGRAVDLFGLRGWGLRDVLWLRLQVLPQAAFAGNFSEACVRAASSHRVLCDLLKFVEKPQILNW